MEKTFGIKQQQQQSFNLESYLKTSCILSAIQINQRKSLADLTTTTTTTSRFRKRLVVPLQQQQQQQQQRHQLVWTCKHKQSGLRNRNDIDLCLAMDCHSSTFPQKQFGEFECCCNNSYKSIDQPNLINFHISFLNIL